MKTRYLDKISRYILRIKKLRKVVAFSVRKMSRMTRGLIRLTKLLYQSKKTDISFKSKTEPLLNTTENSLPEKLNSIFLFYSSSLNATLSKKELKAVLMMLENAQRF